MGKRKNKAKQYKPREEKKQKLPIDRIIELVIQGIIAIAAIVTAVITWLRS